MGNIIGPIVLFFSICDNFRVIIIMAHIDDTLFMIFGNTLNRRLDPGDLLIKKVFGTQIDLEFPGF